MEMVMNISKNIALLMFLYFIQGVPYGFQARFLPVFLRSQGLSLTSVGFFKLLLAPWLCKALWAPLVDRYSTKRKWLLWSIFGLIIACAVSCFISPSNITSLSIVLLSLNVCAATQDIAVDGIAVSILSSDELGQGNTAQVVGYKIGSIFGGGVLVWFIDIIGWTGLFTILTLLYIESWMFVYVSPRLREFGAKTIYNKTGELESDQAINKETNNDDWANYKETSTENDKVMDDGEQDNTYTDKQSNYKELDNSPDEIFKEQERTEMMQGIAQPEKKGIITELHQLFSDMLSTPGTTWLLIFVLVYKLGEQGITGMIPLYLVDKDVSRNDVTFWAGMLGQGLSVIGSLLGGLIISVYRLPVGLLMNQACLIRIMPMGILLQIVMLWEVQILSGQILYYGAIAGYCLLMISGGVITTATFTCMMQCSQTAPLRCQVTHYTVLATIEVLGKLTFASVCGYLVDIFGYMTMFLVFVILSAGVVPMFKKFPDELREDLSGDKSVYFDDNEEEDGENKAKTD